MPASTPNGRPQHIPGTNSSPKGSVLVYPTLGGGTNFQAPSYSPLTGWFYLAFGEGGQVYTSTTQPITRGQQYLGRGRAAGPPPARGPNQPATERGHQGDRSGNRKDRLVVSALSGIADQRRARDRRQRRVRVIARRQHPRARREDRKISLALPDRRQSSGIADELRRSTASSTSRWRPATSYSASPYRSSVMRDEKHLHARRRAGRRQPRQSRPRRSSTPRAATATSCSSRTRRIRSMVSIITSVGMMAYEMKVKGQNVLRFPFTSIDDFRAKPTGLHGIPLLAPWANRLDEQAFYANGKRYPFDMELGNVNGAIPIHGFMTPHRSMAGPRSESRRQGRVGDEPPRHEQAADVDEAVAVRAHDGRHLSPAGRHARSADEGDEQRDRADAGIARMASVLPADGFAARGMDGHHSGARVVAARLSEGADGRDGAGREILSGRQGRVEGLQPGRRVRRSHQRRAGPGHGAC